MASAALKLFQRFGGSAPGRWLVSRAVCWRAPYFRSIAPRIEQLEAGRCVVRMHDRRAVRNHIGTVHAIALCNLAELAGGLATDATIPDSMRWIPKGMAVRYLAKARGMMTATASVPAVAGDGPARELHALIEVRDASQNVVFDADITMWIAPRK
ncbi:hotdog fold domain-containing protein [Dokdonella soli]|uniref:Hotdog fold domain-containing protein n=1 Tax=Dokdonella soli TaxID=529810 RepID=A0ABN1INR2_9GAMM